MRENRPYGRQVATVGEGRFASDFGSDLGPVPW
jgi:hypothetical protein